MIYIKQTKLHIPNQTKGNCLASCFASYFELPISMVPEFEEIEEWEAEIHFWLGENGYDLNITKEDPFKEDNYRGYYFATGISPRSSTINHIVVYKNGKLVHDPHPDNKGLLGKPNQYWRLIKLKENDKYR